MEEKEGTVFHTECASSQPASENENISVIEESNQDISPPVPLVVGCVDKDLVAQAVVSETVCELVDEIDRPSLETPPPIKKSRRRDWSALEGNRPSLRPRKVETPENAAPSPTPSSSKKPTNSCARPTPPPLPLPINGSTVDGTASSHPNMLPPHLPTVDCQNGRLSPALNADTSSSAGSEARGDALNVPRRRRPRRFTVKKRRPTNSRSDVKERSVASPSTADGSLDPDAPEPTLTESSNNPTLCQCGKRPQVFASGGEDLTCQAMDSFDDRVVGCTNPLVNKVGLVRPSTRTLFRIMCDVHLQRLMRHNCCPGCGLFCTQGRFMACSKLHQYHRGCATQPGCLHCGDLTPSKAIVLTLKARREPVFLPEAITPRTVKPAKMSLARQEAASTSLPVTLTPEVARWKPSSERTEEKLASLIGLNVSRLATTIRPDVTPSPPHRYTLKHLLSAVKMGDGVKLLKMMHSGLNPATELPEMKKQNCLHVAAECGHTMIVHLLVQARIPIDTLDAEQNSALSLAVIASQKDVVRYLVKVGASLLTKDFEGKTPLHLAAKKGDRELCELLLAAPNLPPNYVDILDDGGWTPLVWAAEWNHPQVVSLLISKGGNVHIRDSEQNIALHWAAFGGCLDVIELLVIAGSDVTVTNAQGDTPLHVAARENKYESVLLLLARGARGDARNLLGLTPRECSLPESSISHSLALNEQFNLLIARFKVPGPRILSSDISRGRERNPIQCVNSVDDEVLPEFTYVTENCFTSRIHLDRTVTSMQLCLCEDMCTGAGCSCTSTSLRPCYNSEGKLTEDFSYHDPPMIFECNKLCRCNRILCQNRVVQNGLRCRFQLFRTDTRGWGLKTLSLIEKGSFVCEYIGEIISDGEADQRKHDSYLFDLENRDGETYCIDAHKYGNLARFINHRCNYNLVTIRVFVDHHDVRFPRIAFFAKEDIPPGTELGYNYGEKFWMIKYKSFTCNCGSEQCMYSAATIQNTLELYKKKLSIQERLDMAL